MADKKVSADKEKSLYVTQVRYLDEQLERCQLKCDELTKQNNNLLCQLHALLEDKKDICEYLQHSSAAKDKKVDELSELLEVQLQADKQNQQVLELQLGRQKQNLQEEVDRLQSECSTQAVNLEQQKKQLFQRQSDIQTLKKQLDAQKEEQEAAKRKLSLEEEMESRNQGDECWISIRDDLQKKMLAAAEEVKAQHRELLRKVELVLYENQTLWMETDSVEHKATKLQREVDDMKKNLKQVTNSVGNLQQEVEKWLKRCRQLRFNVKNVGSFHQSMLDEEKTLRQNLASVTEDYCQKEAEMQEVKVQLKEEKISRRQLEEDMMEAVIILRPIVTDPDRVPHVQQEMQKLEKILQRTRSVISDSTEEISRGLKLQPAEPKPERSQLQDLSTDPVFLMARYRPGDLGFVPRPTWNLGAAKNECQS